MSRSRKISISTFLLLGFLTVGCLDPYQPPVPKGSTNYLVIDGNINSAENKVIVKISRAINLSDTSKYPAELGATVYVEDETGQFVLLPAVSPGIYAVHYTFDMNLKYRVKVIAQGKEYQSAFVPLENNAPIDSLSLKVDNTEFEILANTHDFSEGVKYYRYTYEETYEYNSVFASAWKLVNGIPVPRPISEDIHTCWISNSSTSLFLTSTETLAENTIANFSLVRITRGDRRLWLKYSLLVNQIELSKEAYEYWSQLRKLTESLGGLFDPLPYQIKGNIASVSNPDEIVLGYFSGGNISQKRIVVANNQLPPGYYDFMAGDCLEGYAPNAEVGSLVGKDIVLTMPRLRGGIIIEGFYYSSTYCVDCRLEGGTNVRPDFMN